MGSNTRLGILDRIKEKRADAGAAFADAVQGMQANQLKSDATKDILNLGMLGLGVGAGGRGLIGLIQMMRSDRDQKTRSGPAHLDLPYPVKQANFLAGDAASSKAGIPWYGPAMLGGGLAGLVGGWKGMDKVLDMRRRRQVASELEQARQQFHDALLGQYDEPVRVPTAKAASDTTMVKVGQALDALFAALAPAIKEKKAFDLSNAAGVATGGYGMYAGLTGLVAGAMMYDKINKRSRKSVLNAALKRRQRRNFVQQPTPLYAEPVQTAAQ